MQQTMFSYLPVWILKAGCYPCDTMPKLILVVKNFYGLAIIIEIILFLQVLQLAYVHVFVVKL